MLTTFLESPRLTAHPFVEPRSTVHSCAFSTLPVSVPTDGEKQQFACPSVRLPGTNSPGLRLSVGPRQDAQTSGRPETPVARFQRHRPRFPPLARPPLVASPQARAPGRAHARGAPGRAGHTPPTHSQSLSLPALAPSPSGVSQSLPVAAGESLLPPSYPLRGGSSGSSGRGRQRKRETDLIKFPKTTTTTKKGPRWGGTPILPRPSPEA